MQASTTYSSTASGLVGCEPMPLVTYSLGLTANQGTLGAGTFVDAAGLKVTVLANIFGVLAFETVTDPTAQIGATVYTSGSFLQDKIAAANSGVTLDAAAIETLRGKNIYLERSIP
jgi:hypothetical protein